ncbi:MAG: thiamine-monophosphate kinase [Methanosarcinaceae archaeon]|nr:thiamine-monophosphate kinase [Methanosarcinaceae archaeon]
MKSEKSAETVPGSDRNDVNAGNAGEKEIICLLTRIFSEKRTPVFRGSASRRRNSSVSGSSVSPISGSSVSSPISGSSVSESSVSGSSVSELIIGPGSDDCAVTTFPSALPDPSAPALSFLPDPSAGPSLSGRSQPVMVSTTDMLHRKTDFPESMSYYEIGWMSAAVNLSDVASMGARPSALLISAGFPASLPLSGIGDIAEGIRDCAHLYGAEIIGGDTDAHDELTIVGTAFGFAGRSEILKRSGAEPGDLVCLTGIAGAAGIALDRIFCPENNGCAGKEDCRDDPAEQMTHLFSSVPDAHLFMPCPRVFEALALSDAGIVTSMTDTSDGLASSLHEIGRQSGTGFEICEEKLPLPEFSSSGSPPDAGNERNEERNENNRAPGSAMYEYLIRKALYDGGDFELLFTIRPDEGSLRKLREIAASFEDLVPSLGGRGRDPDLSHKYPVRFSVIGRVTEPEKGIRLIRKDRRPEKINPDGYSAFPGRS